MNREHPYACVCVYMVRRKMPPGIVIKWFLAICYKKFRLRAMCVFQILYFWFCSIRFAYMFSFFISCDVIFFTLESVLCRQMWATYVSGWRVQKHIYFANIVRWVCVRVCAWIYACAGLARIHMDFCIRRDIGPIAIWLATAIVWLFCACEMLFFMPFHSSEVKRKIIVWAVTTLHKSSASFNSSSNNVCSILLLPPPLLLLLQ